MLNNTKSKKTIYEEKLKSKKGNEYKMIGEYVTMKTKTLFKHTVCGYEWKTSPDNMLRTKKGCPNCSKNKRVTHEEYLKTVKEVWGTEYEVLGSYVNARTPVETYHTVCGNYFYPNPYTFTDKKMPTGCPHCAGKVKFDEGKLNNELSKVIGDNSYILTNTDGMNKKAICKHLSCGYEWEVLPSNMIRNGSRCPYCAGNNKKTHEVFVQEVKNLYGDSYEVIGEYLNSTTHILCKHSCGNVWEVIPNNLLRGRECPNCYQSSKGERKIAEVLDSLGIKYETQKTFKGLIGKRPYRFDFFLPDYDTVIEYDGEQHFTPVNFGGISIEEAVENFRATKRNDNIKNKYCKDNSINILRIPYTTSYDRFLDTIQDFLVTII